MDEGSLSLPILVVVAFVAILAGVTILAIRIYRNHRRENVTEEYGLDDFQDDAYERGEE